MADSTTYYWRIDEKNATGTTTGDVWSFTTVPEASAEAYHSATALKAVISLPEAGQRKMRMPL